MAEKTVFASQLEDKEVLRSLKRSGALEAVLESWRPGLESMAGAAKGPGPGELRDALESLRTGSADLMNPGMAEAIIMLTGYPSLLIRDGDFEEPTEEVWQRRLGPSRAAIKGVIRSVARVELENHPSRMPWIGTCWLVDEDVLVTNQHVAEFFSELHQGRMQIMQGVKVNIDFAEEIGGRTPIERIVKALRHIEPAGSEVDLAFLNLDKGTTRQLGLEPLPIATSGLAGVEFLGVVGYPANDLRNNPLDAFDRIFKGKFGVKRLAPGKVMNASHSSAVFTHNCTTLGGNSGSVVFDLATGAAIGLHFKGNAQVQNFAVKAEMIADRMRKSQVVVHLADAAQRVGLDEARARPENFGDRDGYAPGFLGEGALTVPLPILGPHQLTKVARTSDGKMELKYRHFSAVLSKERRLAFYTAVNIDGESSRNPRRLLGFMLDPRLPVEAQTGEKMYAGNDLDRGHLVRRLDPCWGEEDESKQANRDSMFFPNIAPQHKNLNQKIWNDLEDHILQTVDQLDVRASVFVGCIFTDDDPVQKPTGIKVPMAFWKVVVSLDRPSGRGGRGVRGDGRRGGGPKLQAQAFVMSQQNMVKPDDLEIIFGKGSETFQVTVEQLSRMTGLDFHKLVAADTFGMTAENRESAFAESLEAASDPRRNGHFKELRSLDDVVM